MRFNYNQFQDCYLNIRYYLSEVVVMWLAYSPSILPMPVRMTSNCIKFSLSHQGQNTQQIMQKLNAIQLQRQDRSTKNQQSPYLSAIHIRTSIPPYICSDVMELQYCSMYKYLYSYTIIIKIQMKWSTVLYYFRTIV